LTRTWRVDRNHVPPRPFLSLARFDSPRVLVTIVAAQSSRSARVNLQEWAGGKSQLVGIPTEKQVLTCVVRMLNGVLGECSLLAPACHPCATHVMRPAHHSALGCRAPSRACVSREGARSSLMARGCRARKCSSLAGRFVHRGFVGLCIAPTVEFAHLLSSTMTMALMLLTIYQCQHFWLRQFIGANT
jgi:hypothetical protein